MPAKSPMNASSKKTTKKKTKKVAKKTAAKAAKPSKKAQVEVVNVSPQLRHEMIEVAAYYLAEKRGFRGGDPVADWLASEKDINSRLSG